MADMWTTRCRGRLASAAAELRAQDAPAAERTVLSIETEISAAQLKPLEARDAAVDLQAQLTSLGVKPPATVQVGDIAALEAVNRVLGTRAPDEVRALLRTARASSLGQPWRGHDEASSLWRQGLRAAPPREREVTQAISIQRFEPLSKLHVEAHFPQCTRRDITQMVGDIQGEFERPLHANTWLDEPTRAAALDKLAHVNVQPGDPMWRAPKDRATIW